jgi:hypothetical protein
MFGFNSRVVPHANLIWNHKNQLQLDIGQRRRWHRVMEQDGISWFPGEVADHEWAHVSGWMQLSGVRRHLSCVVPCRNQLASLGLLLPGLTDVLTEIGFPWEVVIVDAASTDGTASAAKRWCRMPGVRCGVGRPGTTRAEAILTGLQASRGDAVAVVDTAMHPSMAMIQQAVSLWSDGARVITSQPHEPGGIRRLNVLESDDESVGQIIDTRDFDQATGGFVLLDRMVVNGLLGEN